MSFATDDLVIHFAHHCYRLAERFALRETGIRHFQSWTAEEARARMGEAQVLVVSGLWTNDLLEDAAQLAYIQGCASGYDKFDLARLEARDIRLCNGRGVNANAVSDHAIALMLTLSRRLHLARDNQAKKLWPGYLPIEEREDELAGKTALIFGLGTIGQRLARLAKAFDMRVIGIKRSLSDVAAEIDALHTPGKLAELLPEADYVILTCPLTPETENMFSTEAFSKMKSDALLINTSRGPLVDVDALATALDAGEIGGAALDVLPQEPPAADHTLFGRDNVILTPHTGFYSEDALLDLQTTVATDVATVLSGGTPKYPVNPKVLDG